MPHKDVEATAWLDYETMMQQPVEASPLLSRKRRNGTVRASDISREVNSALAHLQKQFRIYYFWEEKKTSVGDYKVFMVDQASAAPVEDETERAYIESDHFGMIKCNRREPQKYRSVLAPLQRFCGEAPSTVERRWERATVTSTGRIAIKLSSSPA